MTQHVFSFREASAEEIKISEQGLAANASETGGIPFEEKPFAILNHQGGRLVGSLIGKVFWGWLYIDLLWVEKDFRGSGLGTQLMQEAEIKATALGLTGIYLWTQTWEAPEFYKKLGYAPFVEFQDFPPGHGRLGLRKYLRPPHSEAGGIEKPA